LAMLWLIGLTAPELSPAARLAAQWALEATHNAPIPSNRPAQGRIPVKPPSQRRSGNPLLTAARP